MTQFFFTIFLSTKFIFGIRFSLDSHFFWSQKFYWSQISWHKFSSDSTFYSTKNILSKKQFRSKNIGWVHFWALYHFAQNICLGQQIFWTQIYLRPNIFLENEFVWPKKIFTQNCFFLWICDTKQLGSQFLTHLIFFGTQNLFDPSPKFLFWYRKAIN